MFRIFLLCLMFLYAFIMAGCINPNSPTNCLSKDLETTYGRLENVQAGDPDYAEAVEWSAICPEWRLVSK
jgi:hypothetical protein